MTVVFDQLEMLVTGDPITELDEALRQAAVGLADAASRDDTQTADRFRAWIDARLDERLQFRSDNWSSE